MYFKEVSEADMAVEMLNGRLFGRKVMTTNNQQQVTKYVAGDGGGDMGRENKVQNGGVEGGGSKEAGGVGELS